MVGAGAGQLAHAHEAGVRVLVEAVPEAAAARLLGQIPEGVAYELDGSRRIGHEDEVEVPRVGAEQPQRLLPDVIDNAARQLGGCVGAVGVAVQVSGQAAGEAVYEGPGVDGGAAVVEVDAYEGSFFAVSLLYLARSWGFEATDLCSCVDTQSPGSSGHFDIEGQICLKEGERGEGMGGCGET